MKKKFQIDELTVLFEENSNLQDAAFMKNYMKNQFDFFGIGSKSRREIGKEYLKSIEKPSQNELPAIIKQLWEAQQREFQYFALDLTTEAAKNTDRTYISLYEYMITTKSWWDTVDGASGNCVGPLFMNYPDMRAEYTGKWQKSGNMWLMRCALLFQLKYKEKTDVTLLFDIIRELAGSKEFFIRKAIGWSLREFSKTNEQGVREFVINNKLHPLSAREALKWLDRKK